MSRVKRGWERRRSSRQKFGLFIAALAIAGLMLIGVTSALGAFQVSLGKDCAGTTLIGDQMTCNGNIVNQDTLGNSYALTSIVDTVHGAAGDDAVTLMDAATGSIGLIGAQNLASSPPQC